MTVIDTPTTVPSRPFGAPRVLAGISPDRALTWTEHRAVHGVPALRPRAWLTDAMRAVNLLGRGGAAFPVAVKLEAMPFGGPMTVLVNGSEGEPASYKDRALMTVAPHLVIDGALVVARALGATAVTVAVHDSRAHASLAAALDERPDADAITVVHTRSGFVAGEIRAVVNGLNTGQARPGGRRDLPHDHGLAGRPTFASNVETFAQVAVLARLGAAGYAAAGTRDEPGTSLVTLVGDVIQAGVLEVANGTRLDALLPGRPGALVLVGGFHGTWVRSTAGLTVDRAALRASGSPLGAGVIARPHADTCVLAEVAVVSQWLADQSAGQCGPCFFGLPALADDVRAFAAGRGSEAQVVRRAGQVRGRGACAHPDGAVQFMSSAIVALADDIAVHRAHGTCGRPPSTIFPLPRSES
ncbi:NADH-ubiquinone oxidoreductase-F iron-sulfur binding region domain-containing protein [Aeromicrobium sp. Sec7.5]|uniref:NADH-ubiquinone oxidoreductase-F iron-sulfur binding region domain-containing protein n=1 Tax=Aeromicrobium sp. Sec7.5 TaxID=3121276 RepID=UPI002FE492FA